jgi:hypothetical protein
MPATINPILLRNSKKPAYQYTPAEILAQLPELYATDDKSERAKLCVVKYFAPGTAWTWYGIEFDPQDGEFYGYEIGPDGHGLTYFSLEALKTVRAAFGLPVERDIDFKPTSLYDVKELHGHDHLSLGDDDKEN